MAAKKKASKKQAAKKKATKATAATEALAPDDEPAAEPAAEPAPEAAAEPTEEASAPAGGKPDVASVAAAVMAALAEAGDIEDAEPPRERPPVPKMPARRKDGTIRFALGAEVDAAFMVYALAAGKVDTEDRQYELIRKDQHVLDVDAQAGTYDVTMLSLGLYPEVLEKYMILPCGGSFGDHRGPVLVSRTPIRSQEVNGLAVAVPGKYSTAALALQLWLPTGRFEMSPVPAKHVSLLVRANKVRSGLLVTEDQLTYKNYNLLRVADFGQWWGEETEGLPLPLTLGAIRRDIDAEERGKIALDVKRSIAYALGHREEALEHAMQYARKATPEIVDRFVNRYVNDLSLDCGERGRQSIELIFERALAHGLIKDEVWAEYHGRED